MPKIVKYSGLNPITRQSKNHTANTSVADSLVTASHALLADRASRADTAAIADKALDISDDSPIFDYFAYKDRDDIIQGVWDFVKGMQSKGFSSGAFGSGFELKQEKDGYSSLTVDRLYVRLKAIFDSLEIRRLSHVGGGMVLSPASATIIQVDEIQVSVENENLTGISGNALSDSDADSRQLVYRCKFRVDDGQESVTNDFQAGDLVRCKTFNLTSGQRFSWRRCVNVGTDFIDLLQTDCAAGSDVPCVGDSVVTFGSCNNPDRGNAIELLSYGPGSPSLILYQGINSYSTAGKDKIRIQAGKSKFTGDLFVYADDGTEMPLAAFTRELIDLKAKDIKINGNTQITDSDGNVVALFAGGKLRAALIDADSLTARAIRTADSGARTVIAGNEQLYYDNAGKLVMRVHGNSIDNANAESDFFTLDRLTDVSFNASQRLCTVYFTDDYPFSDPRQISLNSVGLSAAISLSGIEGMQRPEGLPLCSLTFTVALECDGPVDEDGDFPQRIIWSRDIDIYTLGQHVVSPGKLPEAVELDGVAGFGIDEPPYRLVASLEIHPRAVTAAGSFTVSCNAATIPLLRHNGYNEIAADGSALRADADKYVLISGNETTLRHGAFLLKISDAGIQASDNDGTSWKNLI